MVSSQGTSVSINSFSCLASHDIFLFKYNFLLHILRFIFFFSDNIMADVASKQQTTALFLSTIGTCTRKHTELREKKGQTWWEAYAVPENIQFSFSSSFFLHSQTAQFNLESMGPFTVVVEGERLQYRPSHSIPLNMKLNATLRRQIIYRNLVTKGDTRWRSWLRHCATSRKIAGSIADGVTGIFHWHNPSGRTMAPGSTQPLTEMSTKNTSWG
jgi:hypothetical protein